MNDTPINLPDVAKALAAYAMNLSHGKTLEAFELEYLATLAKSVGCSVAPPPVRQGESNIPATLRNEAAGLQGHVRRRKDARRGGYTGSDDRLPSDEPRDPRQRADYFGHVVRRQNFCNPR